ncbi:MAG: N,N-dimethylformamidase beta subunit family domain-containing protein [Methylomicrobium sp.]
MRNPNVKHQYLMGFVFIILSWFVYVETRDSAGSVRAASADQAIKTYVKEAPGPGIGPVAFSRDGNLLATTDFEGNIVLRDVISGQVRATLPDQSENSVSDIAFSADGKILTSISKNTIKLWDVVSGQVQHSLPLADISSAIVQVAVSPDSMHIAGVTQQNEILLWNVKTGFSKSIKAGQGITVDQLTFSPDGRFLASANNGQNSQIKLWDAVTGKLHAALPADRFVTEVEFSPDSTILASGQGGVITLWDIEHLGVVKRILDAKEVKEIAFSPDGRTLASNIGGKEPKIQLWNPVTGGLIFEHPAENGAAITQLFYSPDGGLLASIGQDSLITLLNVPTGELKQLLVGPTDLIAKAAFNSKQPSLAALGNDGGLFVWDLVTGVGHQTFQIPTLLSASLPSSPASTSLNTVSNAPSQLNAANSPVQAQNALQPESGNQIAGQINTRTSKNRGAQKWKGIKELALSQDGSEIGVGTEDGKIRVFNKNGSQRWTVPGHHGRAITGLAFRGKTKELVTTGVDTEIKTWDANGKNLQTFYGPEHPTHAVAVSPDGQFIATAGEDTRVFLYDAVAHKLSNIFSGHINFVNGLAFSPDGQVLASAGAEGRTLLWDVKTGKLLRTLLGHSDQVNAVAFSPDGDQLASASADGTVILWNVITGEQFKTLVGHQNGVRSVAYSPDGQDLVSAGEDKQILLWDPKTGQLKKQLGGLTSIVNVLVFDRIGTLLSATENSEVSEINIETGTKINTIDVPETPAVAPQVSNSESSSSSASTAINAFMPSFFAERVNLGKANQGQSLISSVFNQLLDWVIPPANAAIQSPPGGPVLIIRSGRTGTLAAPNFEDYYTEILRAEGLNEFAVADISSVTAQTLSGYDVVILPEMSLTATQVSMLNTWVTNGGNLIAMRPDSQLASLLGLTSANCSSQPLRGYLFVDTSRSPGNGIVNQTIQYHGAADCYTLSGATSLATLYSNATTATANPALTLNSVGSNGGQAAAFTFDLAKSIVYSRQGNPAWATQDRDITIPNMVPLIRSDDKFYGDGPNDPQPDWNDLNKVAVPQADEQQRLLANLIILMNSDKKPLPRFWYFPNGKKAVVIMTGDDHGNGGTSGRFNQFISRSPAGCNVNNWECVRGTSYIYTSTPLTNTQAANYTAQGFEVGLHINTNCDNFTPASLETFYTQQITDWQTKYTSIPAPITERHHCIAFSDWITAVQTELNHNIRLDTNYYFWPPEWVNNQPGAFTSSVMPMRFTDLMGNMVDVYQATSQMTDESGQIYPFTIDTLLDRALGSLGYYGAYTINAHTDVATETASDAVLDSALSRGVPIVSAAQMLRWLDGRNSSSFGSLTWSGGSLSFTITRGTNANGLQAMVPTNSGTTRLISLTGPSGAIQPALQTIKGVEYAFFSAAAGNYTATYGVDSTSPTVTSTSPTNSATNVDLSSSITATFSEAMDATTITASTFELKDASSNVVNATVSYNASTFTAVLTPTSSLSASTTYTATVKGGTTDPRVKDLAGNALGANVSWSFTTGTQPCATTTCSAWSNSTIPGTPSVNDPGSVELGVKFRSDLNGSITGIRFYQANSNSGSGRTFRATLWNLSGQSLTTGTVTSTTSGWQQVTFTTPAPITANTVYVASYFAPNGNYAATNSPEFSTAGVDNPPIHLLQNGVSGGNGVYAYGTTSTFPTNTFQSTNYWVDVLFTTSTGPDTTPPTVTAQSPTPNATGIATNTTVTATFSEAMDAATLNTTTFELRDSANALISAAVSYNATNRTATLAPGNALTAGATYTATVKGGTTDPRVKDSAGNPLAANVTWSFTIAPSGTQACTSTTSIWPTNPTPTILSDSDTSSVELGVKFSSSQNGFICGIRYYKSSSNTGTHVGKLWNSTGTLLASATFQNETTGWQQVSFAQPVAITANTTYIASYLAPVGRYSADSGYFTTTRTNGPLTALSNADSGGNGVYLYGSGGFPTNTFQSTNYWVDVLFTTSTGPDTTPPTVTSTSPASGATGVSPTSVVTAIFSEAVDSTTVNTSTFELRDSASNLIAGSVTYNAATNTATLTPTNSLTPSTPYTAKIKGGTGGIKDLAVPPNALAADVSWSFTTGVDPCSSGGNPIVCENAKAGNPSSEWDITGAGSLNIQGYATDISVNKGETVRFKINTPSTNYRLDIYRMGYYGGLGARKIATVTPSANLPQSQPACLNNSTTGLIDCGNWVESASWAVPADATSGIYIAKAVRQDGASAGQASHIVFIVRDDASTSDMLFQTSDTTWQAYNDYGGNSLYSGSPAGRAYKVSYNRPFNTRAVDNGQDWVFNAEYPMVRWLEANGYNVSYFTGVDSDRRGNLIANHKVFLSVGHDEYWSGGQRANVEAARDRNPSGVHLAFFSGNEVFWKTRWENNIINTAGALGTETYRTLVCYKETHANAVIDPADPPIWTGTWLDPRFSPPADGGKPQNALTGTLFMVNDGATTAITVPAADGKMRFWRNTSIANLTTGSGTLADSTLGYEWDVDPANPDTATTPAGLEGSLVRPAGLIHLSTTTVTGSNARLQDYGSTYGAGSVTHNLTLYKHSSGALVFGAGTVQWSWGLDSTHDRGSAAADVRMQQATVNLFADMSVQPATLQSGLTPATKSTDITPPSSTITSPTGGSTVALGSTVVISGTATDAGGGLVGGVEVSVDGGTTWHPATGRGTWTYNWTAPGTSTAVTIKSRAVDDSLNLETPGAGVSVNVGSGPDTTVPTVSMTAPANGATISGTAVTVSANATDNIGVTRVQFLLDGASLGAADTVAPYSISWNSTLASNGSHTLSAQASDAANNTATAANISVTVSNTAPLAPSALTGTAVSSTQINLSWTDNATNESGFKIERCQGAGCSNFALVVTLGSNITSYADTGLTPNTSYSYRMVAFNGIGDSVYSNTATAITLSVTGFLSPASNLAVLVNAGDGNGFETTPTNAYANDGLFAVDTNSGTGTGTSCTGTGKDKHDYFGYVFNVPVGATIKGIEVRLDAKADSTTGAPKMCVQLSSDGGITWTAAKSTTTLTTSEATYVLGGAVDTWGRNWSVSNFSAPFRVRVIDVASNLNRDFSLDWVAVQVTYQ